MRVSHAPAEWREIFAEAQVPYAKIMGCAQSGTMRAASRTREDATSVVATIAATTAIKPEPHWQPKIAPETYKLNHNYGKIIS